MPKVATCPSCGAPLSETSVVALAPVCGNCGAVITESGGTLGQTSAYGVNDPTITRKRIEADLAVFCEYKNKYVGMLEACKEQLLWDIERYAKFPNPPELLPVESVPPFWKTFMIGLLLGVVASVCTFLGLVLFLALPCQILAWLGHGPGDQDPNWLKTIDCVILSLVSIAWTVPLAWALVPYYKAKTANGKRPLENVRRQKEYEAACAAARKTAEPVKAAQDHRLRYQIRELDGLIRTMTKKAEDVRSILRGI